MEKGTWGPAQVMGNTLLLAPAWGQEEQLCQHRRVKAKQWQEIPSRSQHTLQEAVNLTGDEPVCHVGGKGKTQQLNLSHLPRVHCSLPSTWKKQEVWIQTGWMQVWEKHWSQLAEGVRGVQIRTGKLWG